MKNNNRTIRLQTMVSESMNEKILSEARKFGISTSSYVEMILGKHLAKTESVTMVDEKRV